MADNKGRIQLLFLIAYTCSNSHISRQYNVGHLSNSTGSSQKIRFNTVNPDIYIFIIPFSSLSTAVTCSWAVMATCDSVCQSRLCFPTRWLSKWLFNRELNLRPNSWIDGLLRVLKFSSCVSRTEGAKEEFLGRKGREKSPRHFNSPSVLY